MEVAYRELTLGIAALFDDPRTRSGGLAAVDRLVHLGQYALGVPGMALAELHGEGGRIIAAAGSAAWAIGRPLRPHVVTTACRPGAANYRLELSEVDPDTAEQLAEVGSPWVLVHRVDVAGAPVALLAAFFTEDGAADPDRLAVMTLLGTTVAQFYREGAGLPVQAAVEAPELADRDLFIAVTSHELRTPVTVIKGYADTLRDHWDQLDDEARHDAARVIGQRTDELARLVDRLLAASTGTAVGTLRPAPFDLLAALRHAAAGLPADLRRRLWLELPPALAPAHGDRTTIPTVLTELVTNAEKYSPGDEPVVVTAAEEGRTVLFRVLDRGIGIPPDQSHRVFDRFWQADSGDGRRYGGAGLGLYLVRKTIERQNGWVSLRPRDGGGTVAEVRLPRGDGKRDAAASREA
ncbi:HAMP domain-containing sensor histidine kinase [Catellatospora sp. KI3]|uniref:sensor histidine kinase n=1 Tax=Catellatospora sp. KI3 TaxID=3041620 RepID=UPI002482D533|nr:HAMP domain-containing sensor histidine kinase [Catellatospora sp. KI3]MDI1461736.1 HAMP domain-containing sensor histidine kinase [Catellatospora sp. KI3]